MWQVPELAQEDLQIELFAFQESLPPLLEELCFFDPPPYAFKMVERSCGTGLGRNWEAAIQEIFAPVALRGVAVQTMAMTHKMWPRDNEAQVLAREWRRKVAG